MMLREADVERIEAMRRRMKLDTKVAVVREALDLLDARLARAERVARWKRAVARVADESARVNREMRGIPHVIVADEWDDQD
jgi:hypothetical protein